MMTMIPSSVNDFEVLILGAGPAGSATALGLLASGVERVLMVDRCVAKPFHIGESATPDVAGLLEKLGLQNDLGQLGHRPYHGNLSLWGGGTPIVDHFLMRGRGHGWHLDRAAFDAWLRKEAIARGARLVSPASLSAIEPMNDGWRAKVDHLGEVTARVLVDAAGRRAPLASRLGARRKRLDTMVALAMRTAAVDSLPGLSLVEPFADGWWYAASLPDGHTLVTLMTDHDVARKHRFYDTAAYLDAWRNTEELVKRIPPPQAPEPIGIFAAHSGFTDQATGNRWIAVGDALMGFDPLTSSGIAGALDDALAAVPAIKSQLEGDIDAAHAYVGRANSTLKRYLAERRKHYSSERRWTGHEFWARRGSN
jgi:flavin-dependent dehydrogenase